MDWLSNTSLFQPHPDIELNNFFGKKFVVDNKNDINKKKSKRYEKLEERFHIEGLRVFLYHSFLEAKTKLKNILYRTPFSLLNIVNDKVHLRLKFKSHFHKEKWEHIL